MIVKSLNAGSLNEVVKNEKEFSKLFQIYTTVYINIKKDIYSIETGKKREFKYIILKNGVIEYVTSNKKDCYNWITGGKK